MTSVNMVTDSPATLRILVALDESPRSSAALTSAAFLAEELQAELAGLFVEDINLQHLIGLPFAREFSPLSGKARPLTFLEIENTWRREAQKMQRQLAETAGRSRLPWSFHVTRGKVFAEVNTMAQACDLLILGRRVGISVMDVTQETYHVPDTPPRGQGKPVLVVVEGADTSSHSLEMGALLARRHGVDLVLLILAKTEPAYLSACTMAKALCNEKKCSTRCVWLETLAGKRLIEAAYREAAGCLVLAGKGRFLSQPDFKQVLDEIKCPIVLTQ